MKIIRAKDYNDMSRKAANIISAQVILKPESVLGLATGSSPIGIYEQLIKWYQGRRRFRRLHDLQSGRIPRSDPGSRPELPLFHAQELF